MMTNEERIRNAKTTLENMVQYGSLFSVDKCDIRALLEYTEELENELYDLKESAYQTQIDFLEANGDRNRYKQALLGVEAYFPVPGLEDEGIKVMNSIATRALEGGNP